MPDGYDATVFVDQVLQNPVVANYMSGMQRLSSRLFGHAKRTAEYSVQIATTLGVPERMLRDHTIGVLLQNVGMSDIPDGERAVSREILNKKGPLNDAEKAFVRAHPLKGYHTLDKALPDSNAKWYALKHHEMLHGGLGSYPTPSEEVKFLEGVEARSTRLIEIASMAEQLSGITQRHFNSVDRDYKLAEEVCKGWRGKEEILVASLSVLGVRNPEKTIRQVRKH